MNIVLPSGDSITLAAARDSVNRTIKGANKDSKAVLISVDLVKGLLNKLEDLDPDKTFTIFWKDGDRTLLKGGATFDQAANNAGYGAGAVAAMDFYTEGDDQNYSWDVVQRRWLQISDKKVTPKKKVSA